MISVVIATYDCASYIGQAIESVLSQVGCTYELIIVDDGSTDNTREIIESYRNNHPGSLTNKYFHYVYQPNQGVCSARNHGIQLAQGEFVAFLDADDFFMPGKLAAQVAVFHKHPELGIVHSGWRRINAEGEMLMDVCPWNNIPDLTLENWLRFKPVLPSAMMFRRSWLEKISGFDMQYTVAEDVDLVLRLAVAGCPAGWLRQTTVSYRQHQQSATNNSLSQAHALPKILSRFFKQPDLSPEIKLIERQVFYSTLVWIAWDLYCGGHHQEMMNCLEKSWSYSPYLPIETIVNWIERFTEYATGWGKQLDVDALTKTPEWRQLIQGSLICSR